MGADTYNHRLAGGKDFARQRGSACRRSHAQTGRITWYKPTLLNFQVHRQWQLTSCLMLIQTVLHLRDWGNYKNLPIVMSGEVVFVAGLYRPTGFGLSLSCIKMCVWLWHQYSHLYVQNLWLILLWHSDNYLNSFHIFLSIINLIHSCTLLPQMSDCSSWCYLSRPTE